jgi:hypothetical protein
VRSVALALSCVAACFAIVACGGSDSSPTENLVTLRFHGDFDFRMDESDGPEHVFTIDSKTSVDRDGNGVTTTDGKAKRFTVPAAELAQLEASLNRLDMDALEEKFSAGAKDATTIAITYEGDTLTVGDRFFSENLGEGNEEVEQVFGVLSLLDRAGRGETAADGA